jgi:pyruvate formate lyase activating enzyme
VAAFYKRRALIQRNIIMKQAYLYKKLKDLKVRCDLCAHRCVVPDNGIGKCAVRKNTGGKLYSLVYDKVISENIDPIEKKPLFHYLPVTIHCNSGM